MANIIEIAHLTKSFRRRTGRRRRVAGGARRRVRHPAGSVGLRQDNDAAADRRIRISGHRHRSRRRRGRDGFAALSAAGEHGLPGLRAVSAHDGGAERRLWPPRIAGVSRADITRRVGEALRMVDLLDKIGAMPAELSGGQRQRVALARAIIRQPKVLLLNEPLSALDVKLREAMQVELKHLHSKLGITFLLVTHDQKEALVIADRVLVMDAGRIVQAGRPADFYERPASPYAGRLYRDVEPDRDDRRLVEQRIARSRGLALKARVGAASAGQAILVGIRPKAILLGSPAEAPAGTCSPGASRKCFSTVATQRPPARARRRRSIIDLPLTSANARQCLPGPGSRRHRASRQCDAVSGGPGMERRQHRAWRSPRQPCSRGASSPGPSSSFIPYVIVFTDAFPGSRRHLRAGLSARQ